MELHKFLESNWITSRSIERGPVLSILSLVADNLERGDTTLGKDEWCAILKDAERMNFAYPYINTLKELTEKWQGFLRSFLRYIVSKYVSTGMSDSYVKMKRAAQLMIRKAIIDGYTC